MYVLFKKKNWVTKLLHVSPRFPRGPCLQVCGLLCGLAQSVYYLNLIHSSRAPVDHIFFLVDRSDSICIDVLLVSVCPVEI